MLPEPYAALLTGILPGVETGTLRALYERFNTTGTSHIIVISEFNKAQTHCGGSLPANSPSRYVALLWV
jgi:hypothetical protein